MTTCLHLDYRNLFAIDYTKDHTVTCEEFAKIWQNLDEKTWQVSLMSSMSTRSDTYDTNRSTRSGGSTRTRRSLPSRHQLEQRWCSTSVYHASFVSHRDILKPTRLRNFQGQNPGAREPCGHVAHRIRLYDSVVDWIGLYHTQSLSIQISLMQSLSIWFFRARKNKIYVIQCTRNPIQRKLNQNEYFPDYCTQLYVNNSIQSDPT